MEWWQYRLTKFKGRTMVYLWQWLWGQHNHILPVFSLTLRSSVLTWHYSLDLSVNDRKLECYYIVLSIHIVIKYFIISLMTINFVMAQQLGVCTSWNWISDWNKIALSLYNYTNSFNIDFSDNLLISINSTLQM